MKNKKLIITLSIIAVLVLTIGITYSIFTSSKTSKNSNLVVGDIYMHYNETNQIQMENAMPTNPYIVNPIMATQEYTKGGTNELSKCVDAFVNIGASENEALSLCKGNTLDGLTLQQAYEHGDLDAMNLTDTFIKENILTINSSIPYFEFTVDGKNTTTNKDIWYEVVLSKGDNIDGKTRIKDNLLRFRLTETKDNKETIVVNNKSYSNLTSKRIWVDTINKNTINEVVHTYKLYMWISNDTVIGNVNQDYTMEEWKDIFASIKINVSGDFNEKALSVETSCFTTQENATGLTITDYNSSCGSNIIIPEEINGEKITAIGPRAFYDKQLIAVDIPKSVIEINEETFRNNNITSINVPDTVINLHCKAFDEGVVKNRDMVCQEISLSCFKCELNSDKTIKITKYNYLNNNSCAKDVIIPKTINGGIVTTVGDYAFENKGLTSIIIPNTVTTIERYAFAGNQLTNVEFSNPSKLERIEYRAFQNNNISTVSIPETVTYLECRAFDNTVSITKSDSLVCTEELQ